MKKNYKIKSVEGNCYKIHRNGKIESERKVLKPQKNGNGYVYVCLGRGNKYRNYYVHRLVAEAFIPNPENKKYVNHIDNDPLNNNDWNLEWSTAKENIHHCKKQGRARYPKRKPVLMFNKNGKFIKRFSSPITAANQLKCTNKLIEMAARKKIKTAKGYIWQYENKKLRLI